jgi:DNA-binding response OmpR family regulator
VLRSHVEKFWNRFESPVTERLVVEHGPVHLLVVDDERRFARLLARRLEGAGHTITLAHTGPDALERASASAWDLALVDVMLPELDGLSLTRELRARGVRGPILILTARDAVPDRVDGLRAGADDYLVKPFAFDELLARIDALARRTGTAGRLVFGPVALDTASRVVTVDGRVLQLTGKEFELLQFLMRAAGRVITRAELKRHVWGFGFDAPTKVADLYVHYLRRKLERAGAPNLIETVRGVGYAIGRFGPPPPAGDQGGDPA